jgi:hypothetical protein
VNRVTVQCLVSDHCDRGHYAVQHLVRKPTGVNRGHCTVSGEYWCEQGSLYSVW